MTVLGFRRQGALRHGSSVWPGFDLAAKCFCFSTLESILQALLNFPIVERAALGLISSSRHPLRRPGVRARVDISASFMAAVRGQTSVWPGFLYLPVSHPAYGCHPHPVREIRRTAPVRYRSQVMKKIAVTAPAQSLAPYQQAATRAAMGDADILVPRFKWPAARQQEPQRLRSSQLPISASH
ncbi:hypothetical protein PS910_01755 [Pseudomonas fluorescens]|nr:hypothetical protein PS910_01755 [Pseudomonas fluorescens]